jgi:hypothetical protein
MSHAIAYKPACYQRARQPGACIRLAGAQKLFYDGRVAFGEDYQVNKMRNNQAANLGEILLTAYTQQQSGLLRVERRWEDHVEKGELYVLVGQPIYARVGHLSGQPALNALLTWQQVQFALLLEAPRPPANLSSRVRVSLTGPLTPPLSPSMPAPPAATPTPQQPASEKRVPRHSGYAHPATLSALTRQQRLIYILIDGQRSLEDLARFSNKSLAEVELIVHELVQKNLLVL